MSAGAVRRVASSEEVRRHNLGTLLRLVHLQGATSRSDLVALTGLNRSTVGALTGQLAELGLVREQAPTGSRTAGRPSIVVAPDDATYAVAVEIGVERLSAARVGLGGTVLDRREVPQTEAEHDPQRTVARIAGLVGDLLSGAPPGATCLGLGVAVCGLVRAADGTVRLAPNLSWVDVPLADLLHEALGDDLPVEVGNEADLGAMAEHVRGAGAGVQDLVYLCGEVGVGGGIILGGRPLTGAGGYAGELGHLVVNPSGRACRCGRWGCWETEIGEDALLLATRRPPGTPREQVLRDHAAGEPAALAGLEQVGRWLGIGVANLVNLLNPEVVLFGGILRDLFPVVEPVVRSVLADALQAPRAQVRLLLPGLGGDSNVVGAAELVFEGLLRDPAGRLAAARRPRADLPARLAVLHQHAASAADRAVQAGAPPAALQQLSDAYVDAALAAMSGQPEPDAR